MTTETVRPGDVVRLAVRNVEANLSMSNALVLAVDPVSPLTSDDGYPSVELVSVNPNALHHAGTSDFDKALIRGISVVNVNHKDFVEGRASLGYMTVADITTSGPVPDPNEDAFYAKVVQERLDAVIGTPSAADLDAKADEDAAKEATAGNVIHVLPMPSGEHILPAAQEAADASI